MMARHSGIRATGVVSIFGAAGPALDEIGLSAWIAQAEPGDMLVFNATWVQLPFAYYFRHYDADAELHGAPVDLFDRGVLEPKMTEADVPHLRALVADEDRVWLVYSHEWYTDPDGIIPRELGTLMRQTDRESFVGLQVLTYVR